MGTSENRLGRRTKHRGFMMVYRGFNGNLSRLYRGFTRFYREFIEVLSTVQLGTNEDNIQKCRTWFVNNELLAYFQHSRMGTNTEMNSFCISVFVPILEFLYPF